MGTAQSTHTTLEINDLPYEGKEVSSSVSGRKANDEQDLVHVDIPMISTDEDEVVETSDEEEDSSDEESDDDEEEGKLIVCLGYYSIAKFKKKNRKIIKN